MPAEIRIVAERRSGMDGWSVYDGQDWFAHATSRTDTLRYASDLLHEGQGPLIGIAKGDRCPKCACYPPESGIACPDPPCALTSRAKQEPEAGA